MRQRVRPALHWHWLARCNTPVNHGSNHCCPLKLHGSGRICKAWKFIMTWKMLKNWSADTKCPRAISWLACNDQKLLTYFDWASCRVVLSKLTVVTLMPGSWLSRDISTVPSSEKQGQPAVRRTNFCKDSASYIFTDFQHGKWGIRPEQCHVKRNNAICFWLHATSLIRLPLDPQYPTLHLSWSDGVLPHEIKPPCKAWRCTLHAKFECTFFADGCFDIPELPVLPLCKFGFTRLQQVMCFFRRQHNWQQSRHRALPFVLCLSPILRNFPTACVVQPKANWLALAANERLVLGSWSQLIFQDWRWRPT